MIPTQQQSKIQKQQTHKKMILYQLLNSFLPQPQSKLLSIMILTILLSYILSLIKNKQIIVIFSITFCLLFHHIMFSQQKYIRWAQQQIIYLLLKFGNRNKIGDYILKFTLSFLAIVHIRRIYVWHQIAGIQVSGIIMVQTFLYISLAYNYQNGLKCDQELSQDQNKRKIKQLPDYLTYTGYVNFLPTNQINTIYEFRDYQDYINRKGDYEKIPNTIKPVLKQLLTLLLTLVVYFGTSQYDYQFTLKPEFAQYSYLFKMFYINLAAFHFCMKFITVWSLSMIALHASGLSYSRKNNNFEKIKVMEIIKFFTQPSFKLKMEYWNISVQTALRRYIYDVSIKQSQIKDQKSKKLIQARAQQKTIFISIFWHGFYPGYFITFFHWTIYLRIDQELFRLRRNNPQFNKFWSKYKLKYLHLLISNFILLYFGLYFPITTFENVKAILYATYGIPLIVLYVVYFIIYEAEMLSKSKKYKLQVNKIDTKKLQ